MAIVELTTQNFEEEAEKSNDIVLIDFWAEWCNPCRMLSPIIDEIAEEGHEGLKVCKINIDEQLELAQKFQVRTIPTLIVLKDGSVKATDIGLQKKENVLKMIESVK